MKEKLKEKIMKLIKRSTVYILDIAFGKMSKEQYKLQMESIANNFKIETPPIILESNDKEHKIDHPYYADMVDAFLEKIKNLTSEENFNILYRNINSLLINEETKYELFHFINILLLSKGYNYKTGMYDSKKNKIVVLKRRLYKKKYKRKVFSYDRIVVVTHELFHMSSTVYDKENKFIYSGFCQANLNNNVSIGRGINEGYTEVLTARICHSTESGYMYEREVVKLLELVVGPKKMTDFYLTANLSGLINELSKYSSIDNIRKFIVEVDLIHESMGNDAVTKEMIVNSNNKILNFLTDINLKKLNDEVESGKLSGKEFCEYSKKVIDGLDKISSYAENKIKIKESDESTSKDVKKNR